MKLSYFSYDFWECCCEAVNAGGWAGVFRRFSAVSLAVNPTHFSIATRVAKPPIAGSSLLLGRAALSARGTTSTTKFALLASISAHARKSSPSARKTPQNRPFFACWANFFAVWTRIHSCWANFFAPMGPQLPHNTCRPPCLKPMTPMRVALCLEMKPLTPLRAPFRTRLKPLTPLLARNDQFRAIFCPQRCHGFHAPLAEHPQRR